MTDLDIRKLITDHPDREDIPVSCIRAVCLVESSNNEWAYRFEPQYKYLSGNKLTMTATERNGQMVSWGLMQVMGGVAREHGFTAWLPELCRPQLGLKYGIMHLRTYYHKYGFWPDAIASYNAGAPRKGGDDMYYNQEYVNKVMAAWAKFDRDEAISKQV